MENIFIFKCCKCIDKNSTDSKFGELFFQYLRVKNEVFQSKVQGNMIKGLENFKEYFNKSVHYELNENIEKEKDYWKLLMLNQFQNSNLKKLDKNRISGKTRLK